MDDRLTHAQIIQMRGFQPYAEQPNGFSLGVVWSIAIVALLVYAIL